MALDCTGFTMFMAMLLPFFSSLLGFFGGFAFGPTTYFVRLHIFLCSFLWLQNNQTKIINPFFMHCRACDSLRSFFEWYSGHLGLSYYIFGIFMFMKFLYQTKWISCSSHVACGWCYKSRGVSASIGLQAGWANYGTKSLFWIGVDINLRWIIWLRFSSAHCRIS